MQIWRHLQFGLESPGVMCWTLHSAILSLGMEGGKFKIQPERWLRIRKLEAIVFLQSPLSPHKTIRPQGVTPPKKMNRKGELQTSRISSNLRIWQSYSRVPQILKVLCVWYSWKYVARLGFDPLKFLYSEFLYNTQAVYKVYIKYKII